MNVVAVWLLHMAAMMCRCAALRPGAQTKDVLSMLFAPIASVRSALFGLRPNSASEYYRGRWL